VAVLEPRRPQVTFCVKGVTTAPCGVPTSVLDHSPSSDTPALSQFWTCTIAGIPVSGLRSASCCNYRVSSVGPAMLRNSVTTIRTLSLHELRAGASGRNGATEHLMGDGSYIPFAQDQETEEIADGVALCPFEVAMKRGIFELADRGTLFLD
jgi:hypothetical protein